MAAAGAARELLARLDEALAFEGPTREELEAELPAKVLVEHAVDTRKKQKWMCSQLHVVKFLLEFLDQRDSASGLEPWWLRMVQAKQQWKLLKVGYQQRVEAIEGAWLEGEGGEVRTQESWLPAPAALITRPAPLQSRGWNPGVLLSPHRSSALCQLLETLQGVRLVSASADEIDMELTPDPQPTTPDPQPLRLTLCWAEDGSIRVRVSNGLGAGGRGWLGGTQRGFGGAAWLDLTQGGWQGQAGWVGPRGD
uniref:Uncharacterized protein n=1 Tax=Chelydra serpentina TaxID=8475 RepID=A0A8C3SWM8_CHESE